MRIYKWVPISGEAQKKKPIIDASQNSINVNDKENSKIPRDLQEDSSNTCKFYRKFERLYNVNF